MKPYQAYNRYLLGLLLLILAASFLDRVALGILLQSVKAELHLSDTQLGFMSGFAFALFYSVLGLPIARWADRGDRVGIISLSAALSGVMVAMCALVGSFWQLLLVRVFVGIGEAGCVPAANSLISSHFSRAERPRAAAIYWLGTTVGLVVGYLCAGWCNDHFGWRTTFLILGVPGVLLGGIAYFTLHDPRRRTGERYPDLVHPKPEASVGSSRPLPLTEVASVLWRIRSFRHLLLCLSVMNFFTYGVLQWQPTFFLRTHSLSSAELGAWFAFVYALAGFSGIYGGGAWAARYAPRDEGKQFRASALVFVALGAIAPVTYLVPSPYFAFVSMGLVSLGISAICGPFLGAIQSLVPPQMRALAIAIVYLIANLIGMGLGPLAVGVLSDALSPRFGTDALRFALVALTPGYLWCAWHFWQASKTVARDLDQIPLDDADMIALHQ